VFSALSRGADHPKTSTALVNETLSRPRTHRRLPPQTRHN
jgi:hypothetical protein